MKRALIAMTCAALAIAGCQRQAMPGSRTVVERSHGSKPGWVEQRSWDQDADVYFVGSVEGVRSLTLGEEQAEYQAKKTIASAIRETFQREFASALSGSNSVDRSNAIGEKVESAIAASTDKVQVRGVIPVERYWEKLEIVDDDRMAYGWNVALKVKLPKTDFERAKKQVFESMAQSEQIRADAEAGRLIEKVKAKLTN